MTESGALADLPPLRDVIAQHDLRADKSLGQNFLMDSNITDKIARAAGDLRNATVFEIGPGPGGLTRSLLRAGADNVVALEFDPRAVGALQDLQDRAEGRLRIVQADALKSDLLALAPAGERIVVANLPYNIATPLLLGWLRQIRRDPSAFRSLTLMFQREVADRITAPKGSKTFGRLAVVSQWLCHVKKQFDLPPSVFVPPPKITSSVVHFTPRVLDAAAPGFDAVEKITAAAFGQRRKMLRSSLKAHAAAMTAAGIDDSLRAEQLDIADFIRIAGHI